MQLAAASFAVIRHAILVVALAAAARAQAPSRELALELLHPERGEAAMWTLLEAGNLAVAPLLDAYDVVVQRPEPDWALARELVRLLGLLGAEAKSAVPALAVRLAQARPVLHEILAWALGETALHAPQADADTEDALRATSDEAARLALVKLSLDSSALDQFASRGGNPRTDTLAGIALPELLLSRAAQLRAFAEQVAEARAVAIANWGKLGPHHQRGALAWERVFVAVSPEDPECVHAWGNLLQHGDPRVRLEAVRRLGELGARAAVAVPHLAATLRDGSLRVARAAALQLATLGAAASAAQPALEAAARRPGLERFAQAALVSLARVAPRELRAMSPAERAVHAFVTAPAAEREGAAAAVRALGAAAVPLLEQALWDQPFDPARAELRDALFAVLVDLGPVAAPTLPALFWWAQQRPGDPPVRHALLVYVAALGPRACAHYSYIAATIAGWRYQLRGAAAQDALAAALRALCAAPDSCLEVAVCGYEPAQRYAIEQLATQPELGDAAPRLETIALREAGPSENPERARVRAMAAALALTRADPPLRNLWVVLVRDGTLDEQRRVVRQLAARGARDRFLWERIAEHEDAVIRAIATAQLNALGGK